MNDSKKNQSVPSQNAAEDPSKKQGSSSNSNTRPSNRPSSRLTRQVDSKEIERLDRRESKNQKRLDKKAGKLIAASDREAKWQLGVSRIRTGYDRTMIILLVVLLCLGSIAVFSASYPSALAEGLDGSYYIVSQLRNIALGFIAMLATMIFTPEQYKKLTPLIYLVALLLLAAVLFVGMNRDEARRWLPLGPLSFQPSEAMKPALVMALALYFQKFRPKFVDSPSKRNNLIYGVILPFIIIGAAAILVLLENHLSGTLIICAIGVVVMLFAGSDPRWIAAIGGGAGIPVVAWFLWKHPYALKRIITKFDPNANVQNEKWQTTQGVMAIGSGGLFGLGLGNSRQKYSYVSEAHNDFIFTIWCEEMGFVGAIGLIALFAVFIYHGYSIAKKAPDTFSSLLVFGIMSKIAIQVLLNLAVVTDLIFNTGVSLPFFSYGGSSLIFQMAEMGIVLSVSRYSYMRTEDISPTMISEKKQIAKGNKQIGSGKKNT